MGPNGFLDSLSAVGSKLWWFHLVSPCWQPGSPVLTSYHFKEIGDKSKQSREHSESTAALSEKRGSLYGGAAPAQTAAGAQEEEAFSRGNPSASPHPHPPGEVPMLRTHILEKSKQLATMVWEMPARSIDVTFTSLLKKCFVFHNCSGFD